MQDREERIYDGAGAYGRGQFQSYRSPARRMHIVLLCLCAWSLAALASFVAELGRLDIVDRIARGDIVPLDDAAGSDHLVQITAAIEVAMYVVAGIAFLCWVHRIVANNLALGALQTRFSPGFAVGCWFIPFANLLLPLLAFREAWRAADPARLHSTLEDRDRSRVTLLVLAWWVCFSAGNVVSYGAGLVRQRMDVVDALRASSTTQIVATVLAWVAALLAMVVVIQLTHRQEAKAAAVDIAFGAAHLPVPEPEVALTGVPTAHLQPSAQARES